MGAPERWGLKTRGPVLLTCRAGRSGSGGRGALSKVVGLEEAGPMKRGGVVTKGPGQEVAGGAGWGPRRRGNRSGERRLEREERKQAEGEGRKEGREEGDRKGREKGGVGEPARGEGGRGGADRPGTKSEKTPAAARRGRRRRTKGRDEDATVRSQSSEKPKTPEDGGRAASGRGAERCQADGHLSGGESSGARSAAASGLGRGLGSRRRGPRRSRPGWVVRVSSQGRLGPCRRGWAASGRPLREKAQGAGSLSGAARRSRPADRDAQLRDGQRGVPGGRGSMGSPGEGAARAPQPGTARRQRDRAPPVPSTPTRRSPSPAQPRPRFLAPGTPADAP